MALVHATCVAIGGRGVLLFGRPGTGKSDLALRLIDRGAVLVSDDQTAVARQGASLIASCPPAIAGRLEIRGLGIVDQPALASAPVALAVVLDRASERMPADPLPARSIEGIAVPEIALAPLEASAPLKLERALALWGRS